MDLIEVSRLTKYYRMGDTVVRALDGVDLSIAQGEFVAITGASGSGKSTMMHLLGCLDRPTAGRYVLDGSDVSDLSDGELAVVRNKQIGFVFQTFNLINRTTAWENVAVPLFYARQTNTRAPALRALQRVGLESRAQHNPNELSGGERQRVAIARAIVNDPMVVLADEPTGNLDSRTGEQIMEIFHDLNAQGVTIVIVTHEPDIAGQARRVVQMRDGKVIADDRRDGSRRMPEARVAALPDEPVERAPEPTRPAPDGDARADAPVAPRRRMRGTTAALVCGLLGLVLLISGASAQFVLSQVYQLRQFDPSQGTPLPMPALVGVAGACGALLAALVLGVVAIVLARGAQERIRTVPGNWSGGGQAVAGLILGWLTVGIPLAAALIAVSVKVFGLTR